MRIVTPNAIENVAWEGELESAGAVYKSLEPSPRVTLGEPVSWPVEQALETQTDFVFCLQCLQFLQLL
jgi:hypothetical protein